MKNNGHPAGIIGGETRSQQTKSIVSPYNLDPFFFVKIILSWVITHSNVPTRRPRIIKDRYHTIVPESIDIVKLFLLGLFGRLSRPICASQGLLLPAPRIILQPPAIHARVMPNRIPDRRSSSNREGLDGCSSVHFLITSPEIITNFHNNIYIFRLQEPEEKSLSLLRQAERPIRHQSNKNCSILCGAPTGDRSFVRTIDSLLSCRI